MRARVQHAPRIRREAILFRGPPDRADPCSALHRAPLRLFRPERRFPCSGLKDAPTSGERPSRPESGRPIPSGRRNFVYDGCYCSRFCDIYENKRSHLVSAKFQDSSTHRIHGTVHRGHETRASGVAMNQNVAETLRLGDVFDQTTGGLAMVCNPRLAGRNPRFKSLCGCPLERLHE